MTRRGEWLGTMVPSSFGPIEGLLYPLDAEEPTELPDRGLIFPVTVTLLRGEIRGFAEAVQRYADVVNKSIALEDPPLRPIFAIPPQEDANLASQFQFETAQKPAPYALFETGTLLVRSDFMRLLSITPEKAGFDAPNPADDVAQFILGSPLPEDALPGDAMGDYTPLPAVTLPDKPPTPGIAITAVIDDGLPIANTRFRKGPTSTRIAYAWIQDGRFRTPISHVHYGREFTGADIDTLLTESVVAGSVDEDLFYRRAGMADFSDRQGRTRLGRRLTHGANVMDQAAGYGPEDTQRPDENPIIAVQLPYVVTADTSGLSLESYVVDALRYIVDRADRIADALEADTGPLPLVINFSYGFTAGPHDGTHPLELLMEKILSTRNRPDRPITAIVLPSGNSRQVMCHAQLKPAAEPVQKVKTARWRVLPDDRTPSYAIFYMPTTPAAPVTSRVSVRLVTPTGETSPPLDEAPGQSWSWKPGPHVLAKISYQYIGTPTERGRFVVAVRPTRQLDRANPIAPSGDWLVEFTATDLAPDAVIEAYVQRDDTPFGFVERGRQSYFIDPEYKRFDVQGVPVDADRAEAYVKRAGTMNAIATGASTVVVGGFERYLGEAALYSAGGPVLGAAGAPPNRVGPNGLAVSDTTRVHRGVLGATTRSGALESLNGTSVAAPQVAREIAFAMSTGQWAGPATIESWIPNPISPPDARRGAGRIALPPVHPIARVDWPG